MKRFNRRALSGAVLALAAALFLPTGCTEVDDTLGAEYIPINQEMKLRTANLRACFETGLHRADSVVTSNIGSGFFGTTRNDTFGLRTAGFFTQYRWVIKPSDEGFGYRPIFDSAQLIVSVASTGGDTTIRQNYEVYEIADDSFLTDSDDSTFYGTFDITPYLSSDPAFTFTFPDQDKGIYTTTPLVTMQPTRQGRELIERLMLLKDDLTIDIFDDQAEWYSLFKGLYIKPAAEAGATSPGGNLMQTTLEDSGFVIYGRNRDETDPSLIRDTTTSVYYFYYDDSTTENLGNQSINTFTHDYRGALLGDYTFDQEGNSPPTDALFVEGMSGVVGSITFTDELFEQLEQLLLQEKNESGLSFTSMAFSKATLYFYGRESSYVWEDVAPTPSMLDWLGGSLPRLGLYTSFASLTAIPDYNYAYEEAGYTLTFDGYLNRSQGCYMMDIKNYLQTLWNSYLSWKAGGIDEIPNRTIYLAPEASSANTFSFASVQGMGGGANDVPMKLEIAYVMTQPQK